MTKQHEDVGEVSGQVFVSYGEAQRMLPFFREMARTARLARIRKAASAFVEELDLVRDDVDYAPLGGRQILLTSVEAELLSAYYETHGGKK